MREVAQAAGVSMSTVANVLSRPSIVAPETRRRVEEAIDGVGYVPSAPARQMRGAPSTIVGSITLDLANPFYAELNRGIEDRVAEQGCLLLACSSDLRPAKERQLLGLLHAQTVRGVVLTPIDPDPQPLLRLHQHGIPVVLVDHPGDGIDVCAATVDDELGGRLAADHLLALGHRRIAFLGAEVNPVSVERRLAGVRRALAAAGLDPARALLEIRMPVHPPPLPAAAAAATRLILAADPPPTAVVCLNDTGALGLLEGLDAAGVRVPGDLSVVGYDDLPFARRLAPALTTVSRPTYELGRTAADLLLEESQPGHGHRVVRFEPELIVRASTAPPRRTSTIAY